MAYSKHAVNINSCFNSYIHAPPGLCFSSRLLQPHTLCLKWFVGRHAWQTCSLLEGPAFTFTSLKTQPLPPITQLMAHRTAGSQCLVSWWARDAGAPQNWANLGPASLVHI